MMEVLLVAICRWSNDKLRVVGSLLHCIPPNRLHCLHTIENNAFSDINPEVFWNND